MNKNFQELMERDSNEISNVMKEVREMRLKISEEFGNDLAKFIAHCQKVEKEWRKSGKYKFVNAEDTTEQSETAKKANVVAAD